MTNTPEQTEGDGAFGVVARAAGTATQVGLSVVAAPLVLLPAKSRRHARRAIAELARGVVALPRGVSHAVTKVVDDIWADPDALAPRLDGRPIADRARSFAERVANAAEDVSSALGTIARRTGDAIERGATGIDDWTAGRSKAAVPVAPAKTVDDWVEKSPDTKTKGA